MKQLVYSITVDASAKKVYDTMLGLENINTYEQWTAAFNPTSTYEGSWDKGSKIYFVGTDGDGNRGGMVSEIAENIPNEYVSIRHYGILKGETEITEGPEVEPWAGGLENYRFTETDGKTTISVETDSDSEYESYFNETWPKALQVLKELVEG
ncbi:tungsten formylmethanofuran dehydrogenase [Hanstruepera neustonica]|uniref:Tungsten formylmethanofuran dehydrogenase n=1 Tax=Hanstruepera neustonica TaxID=1445657 RepID=A0A2K1DX10_9FLAO|nr:SRPBCC domain-containing protein [Hanstruepera neustonica]PNQ72571.1 tungsten formylmethanofuran dehydrogenase [Hanstruepera neustonica]